MKVGIMQPYFFPYIGYWQLINAVDKYVIYDDVNYIKGGWINRNNILIQGDAKFINLQIEKASPNKLINETRVLCNFKYNEKLLKTIKESYSKAPFFKETFSLVGNIVNQNEDNLAKYLTFLTKEICGYLSINTEILISSDVKKRNDLKGQDNIIEICKNLHASKYINAVGGQNLYSYTYFENNGIELRFLKTNNIKYVQFQKEEFVQNLSIIDIMMFNSPSEIRNMLNEYILI
ncbi:WbqC family protein [Lysinibacillus piscis]|uniref:WbqC-like protein family protein n=1 Tax=Lysinibacillus piscis TaxID=2518931 RepID=A0ABQ5NIB2_9BACI|nr:WbqC family protein [Lysinibacillus sp. KH24]GLC87816.1 hypothetical protein LYSBPC_09430 [Lysinibacillus sp. KH24]